MKLELENRTKIENSIGCGLALIKGTITYCTMMSVTMIIVDVSILVLIQGCCMQCPVVVG